MEARVAGAPPPATTTAAAPEPRAPRADVGAEHATMDELDAQMALLAAEKGPPKTPGRQRGIGGGGAGARRWPP